MRIKIGDIILVPFPYTNLQGNKLRPSVVLFITNLDVTMLFMTSNLDGAEQYDVLLRPNTYNNLSKPTIVKVAKMATIEKSLARRNYGYVSDKDRRKIIENLIDLLKEGY